jgi:hypothetical protein
MNTNHGGYTESPWVTELRNQKRKAVEFAYEVFNASTLTDDEIKALDAALEACATDPAHILNAEQFPFDVELKTEKRIAFADSDLGTKVIVSGGEVLELDSHLEAQYDEQNGDIDLPF